VTRVGGPRVFEKWWRGCGIVFVFLWGWKAVSTINEHLKNVFSEKELSEEGCVKKFGISEFQQKAPLY